MFKDLLFIKRLKELCLSHSSQIVLAKNISMQCFSVREHYSKEITPFSGIAFISVKLICETSNDPSYTQRAHFRQQLASNCVAT